MLVACDDGSLHYVSLSFSDEGQGSFFFLETKAASQEHEDIITAIDISQDGTKVMTSSYDKTVVVLDVNTLRLEERLSDIHHEIITSVAANRVNPNLIATSANDGIAAAWDLRAKDNIVKGKCSLVLFKPLSQKSLLSYSINILTYCFLFISVVRQ